MGNIKYMNTKYKEELHLLIPIILLVFLSWFSLKMLNTSVIELLNGRSKLSDVLGYLNYFIILFTFIALVWYSLETYKLRKLQKRQIDLSLTPVLTLSSKYSSDEIIDCVKNIGKGVANNVEIEKFVDSDSVEHEFDIELKVLAPNESACIYVNGRTTFVNFLNFHEEKINLQISFENIEGDKFKTILEIIGGHTRIVKQEQISNG